MMGYAEMVLLVESLTQRPANAVERNIASAISDVVESSPQPPVFADVLTDEVVLLETAWRESRFDLSAVGDNGRATGAFQLWNVPRGLSVQQQTAIAYDRVRDSARRCGPEKPIALAGYVGGSCTNRTARKVSAFRLAEIAQLIRMLEQTPGVVEAQR